MSDSKKHFIENFNEICKKALGGEVKIDEELATIIKCALEAASKTAETEITSNEYTVDTKIGIDAQESMVDEALGDYDGLLIAFSEAIDGEM